MNSTSIVSVILAGILTDNILLSKFLGIGSSFGDSKNVKSIFPISIAVTFVTVISTAVTWPVYRFLLYPNFTYLETVVFVLLILGIVWLIEWLLKKFIEPIYNTYGKYMPLVITNSAVLGVTMLNVSYELNFIGALVNALASGVGFMLALLLFSGVRQRIESSDIPGFLKGLPITFVAAAIISIAVMGLTF